MTLVTCAILNVNNLYCMRTVAAIAAAAPAPARKQKLTPIVIRPTPATPTIVAVKPGTEIIAATPELVLTPEKDNPASPQNSPRDSSQLSPASHMASPKTFRNVLRDDNPAAGYRTAVSPTTPSPRAVRQELHVHVGSYSGEQFSRLKLANLKIDDESPRDARTPIDVFEPGTGPAVHDTKDPREVGSPAQPPGVLLSSRATPTPIHDDSPTARLNVTLNRFFINGCIKTNEDFSKYSINYITDYLDKELLRNIELYARLQPLKDSLDESILAEIFFGHPQRHGIIHFVLEMAKDEDLDIVVQQQDIDLADYVDQKFAHFTDRKEFRKKIDLDYKAEMNARSTVITALNNPETAQEALKILIEHPYSNKIIGTTPVITALKNLVQRPDRESVSGTADRMITHIVLKDMKDYDSLTPTHRAHLRHIKEYAMRQSTRDLIEKHITPDYKRVAHIKKFMNKPEFTRSHDVDPSRSAQPYAVSVMAHGNQEVTEHDPSIYGHDARDNDRECCAHFPCCCCYPKCTCTIL